MNPLDRVKELEPARKAFSLLEEFKAFAFKGNVIDLAVAVVIGTAFGKVIDALVKSVFMPLIGIILPGDKGYEGWVWVLNGREVPYGKFLGEVVNFLIVALAMFFFTVKFLGWMIRNREKQEEKDKVPPLTKDQELLAEIRDLLKDRPG